ncbi:hypothetical protein Cgig2_007643 [Carnegiea gigantea]|uniref:Endonuclease/exonuclease/phosphatase domain-containing protein n=1 Tax=Carnegiea gigantea TaxID=171969 RepID=A0A9Q1GHP5_9CARY|nr:hypothetical protein Cgig2_007643 [Carnegiea gigantea]
MSSPLPSPHTNKESPDKLEISPASPEQAAKSQNTISLVSPDKVAEPHNAIPPIKSSYTALVNPDEGTSQSFITSLTINGKKCPKLEPEDVAPEVDYWQSVVLCTVLGANPPLEVIDRSIPQTTADAEGFTSVPSRGTARSSPRHIDDRDHPHNWGIPSMGEICSWNIRGLNWPNKQEDLKIFLQLQQIAIIGLLETKIKIHNFGKTTMQHFYLTFIYVDNHESPRQGLWAELEYIALDMNEAWCVLGDFNSMLYSGDRIGGNPIQDHEVKSFTECIHSCGLQELPSKGSYFSWTNKTIWSRIDRAFVNTLYQVLYMSHSLSDHTPLLLHLINSPKPRKAFHFCEMWTRDPSFQTIIHNMMPAASPNNEQLKLAKTQAREHYTSIISSALAISYEDASTRYFYAKAKQRKLESYVYELKDEEGRVQQGFPEVAKVIFGGCSRALQDECLKITKFQEGSFPLRYLGVPITASKLNKSECRVLVEKIIGKVRLWSSRSLSFARRAQLLNSIVFGMFSYWSSMFIIPQEVIDQINAICRKFFWGGEADYTQSPYIASSKTCIPKKHRGIELKNLSA